MNKLNNILNKVRHYVLRAEKRYNIRGFRKDNNYAEYIVLNVKEKDIRRYVEKAVQAGWYRISLKDVDSYED